MTASWTGYAYLISSVLFILALRCLSSPETARRGNLMRLNGIDAELLTEASTALSSFVSDPKTLTIKLAPAEPLAMSTLAEMEDPSALTKESLGFSAANE